MYCHNGDPKRLGFFQLEKGGTVRVETCENCKGYLKIIKARMGDTVYALTHKRHNSKTSRLADKLTKMGFYARALKEQQRRDGGPKHSF